jgi:hypothetical protein
MYTYLSEGQSGPSHGHGTLHGITLYVHFCIRSSVVVQATCWSPGNRERLVIDWRRVYNVLTVICSAPGKPDVRNDVDI